MPIGKKSAAAGLVGAVSLAIGAAWVDRSADAADHLDPPARTDPASVPAGVTADTAADIADVFAFNNATTVTTILTTAGPRAANLPPVFDANVLYRIHISNDGNPASSEFVIDMRWGRNPAGNWGVQFTGIPGSTGPLSGPVQTMLAQGTGIRAIAGLFDDPFFFDLQGFNETRSTGTIAMRSNRDFFAGKNDTSFVVDFPRAAVANGSNPITIWAETRRI